MSGKMKKVFGQATRYQRQQGNGSAKNTHSATQLTEEQERAQRILQLKLKRRAEDEALDERFGYSRYSNNTGDGSRSKRGWIFNILPTTITATGTSNDDSDGISSGPERAGLDLFFLGNDGSTFKSTVLYDPYFFVIAKPPSRFGNRSSMQNEEDNSVFFETIISNLMRKFEGHGLKSATIVKKHDLDALNHLGETGSKGLPFIKLSFDTVDQLIGVRRDLQPIIQQNQKKEEEAKLNPTFGIKYNFEDSLKDPLSNLIDMREYDVPYLVRVCIDLGIRAGAWYTVTPNELDCGVTLSEQDIETKAEPSFLAFDIECTKAPLKFPDANVDSIFMISYMVEGQGYLIISRHVVSQDVQDFEYTPKPSYPGPFKIFNEQTEEDLIRRFLSEYQRLKPQIVVTYNGDFFDWPFLEQRCAVYGLNLRNELGVERVNGGDSGSGGEYRGRSCVHMDAFSWVQRDSYLPQGAQGLKAVTKYKLGYDPVEVDPEDMVQFAKDRPVHMASYSVSDAVATYYLYMKYVHMFIFSLCTIIPMGPEDVLRKGSGTLCEALLMVQACEKSIICPNKQKEPLAKFHEGHLLESETYIGGKVECLETGVYRSDIEYKFDLKPSAFQELIDNIDRDLTFAIEVEGGIDRSTITNYDEIRCEIIEQLELLRDRPNRTEKPYVYHLDVGAMYPNIILTNRLQPSAMVDDATCAACDFNQEKNNCKRKMEWVWRGDYNPATKSEYENAKEQLSRERFENGQLGFHDLSEVEQAKHIATRLKDYSKKAYNKSKVTREVTRKDTICMRENDFYVNTVRDFRDKRYELKKLTKVWGGKVKKAKDPATKKEAEDKALVYDSLQVAHKCILNSFYGYVMRKGARWRSMEMAGIVTKTGADLITQARKLVEQIGRPLELDTDGIWCILPQSFPDVFYFKTKSGGKLKLEYPCIMLNADVHNNFTNHQYQTLKDSKRRTYETRSECSIFFEVDGPYRCMVLPASTEEGKLLKKRYAVFNFDGSLAELKGFELKRRGELELIKTFQSQVFERFLNGKSLEECYDSVADIANHWLDVIDTQGESLDIDELVDLISENRSMSRQLEEYGDQKGTSQTTARRLGEFLGAEIIKDKGLNCKFIIAERPHGAPVTERAIPTAIWKAEPAVMKEYLRKWLKSPQMEDDEFDLRNILDWDYYKERLGKTIQKIITIPAALQKIENPVPRLPHPEWLQRTVRRLNDRYQQKSITSMFGPASKVKMLAKKKDIGDIEDMMANGSAGLIRPVVHRRKTVKTPEQVEENIDEIEKTELSSDTFQDWLARKKKVWNFKERRKRGRAIANRAVDSTGASVDAPSKKQKKAVGSMEGFVRDAAQSLIQSEWHIIEVRDNSDSGSSGGDITVWVMLQNGSLQKVTITVPRSFYVNCKNEIKEASSNGMTIRKVEKHLPHNKVPTHLYEVSMPEHVFRSNEWLQHFKSKNGDSEIISFFELEAQQSLKSILRMGCMCRVNRSLNGNKSKFAVSDLKKVSQSIGVKYLNPEVSFKKIFFYERMNSRSGIGMMGLFVLDSSTTDLVNDGKIDLSCQSFVWIVKPGGEKSQQNVSRKMCETIFSELLQAIQEQTKDDQDSKYGSFSMESDCAVKSLSFTSEEDGAYRGVQEVLNMYNQGNNGPTLLLLNASKSTNHIRKKIPTCNLFPIVALPSPPGADAFDTSITSLNWERDYVQNSFESYFHMLAESFEKQVNHARYAEVPIGNLGNDPIVSSYDIMFSRVLEKNRAILWVGNNPGNPDLGIDYLSVLPGSSVFGLINGHSSDIDSNDIWREESENYGPSICYPGAYRTVCAEIDIHYLAIAALCASKGNTLSGKGMFGTSETSISTSNAPLGDEMSTSISLPLLMSLIQKWLHDASVSSDKIADNMLGHVYRLISSSGPALHDPALHRVVVSLMKTTFNKLLGEFQRLGSSIVFATFNRIIIDTNKTSLLESIEYVDFVIATIMKKMSVSGSGADFEHLSLEKNRFYANYILLDEHNYGGLLFENREPQNEDESQLAFEMELPQEDGAIESVTIVPTVESGWNIVHYLPNEMAQEYFRLIISRFSKDIYKKQIAIREKGSAEDSEVSYNKLLLDYKKLVITKHFPNDLTTFVDELDKEPKGPNCFPVLPGSHLQLTSPPLEFIKNIISVLELDSDIHTEVQKLKRDLLTQINVQEYSHEAQWKNPCASFILPDVFCTECQECRDVDLCILPPIEEDQSGSWKCDDCGTPYNSSLIEKRLVGIIERKCLRYQLQDLRCSKSGRVSTSLLAKQSRQTSQKLQLDISREEIVKELRILHNLAVHYELDWLIETTMGLLGSV